MLRISAPHRAILASKGVHTPALGYVQDGWRDDFNLAMDAQPALVTTSNVGIPAFLSNLIDPEVVRVLLAPTKAAEIFGEQKKGDWTLITTQFPVMEMTGQVTSYGDYNADGSTGVNVNWVPRQSYHFQTVQQYGERELEMYGLAKINYVSELDVAAANSINRFRNQTYFYGVAGLQNYGALNDPSLLAAISPLVKASGGTNWADPKTTALEMFADVRALFTQLVNQLGGLVDINMASKMKLLMSPLQEAYLLQVSAFNVPALTTIKQAFPGLEILTAPEYATANGQLLQLILADIDGVSTTYCAFTEKLRVHPVVPGNSSWSQKKSGGTWGTIIRRPVCIAQMLGV